MKILFIGGTRFYGKHMVEIAVANGHEVAVLSRFQTPVPQSEALFSKVEILKGDGIDDLPRLVQGRAWDAVIDVCA
ncbi:hypothetical protein BC938DRAFT_471174, partial [Jimgerdemannia flammicorona]